jgi:O-antigen ligase
MTVPSSSRGVNPGPDALRSFLAKALNIFLLLFLFSLPLSYITSVREITLGGAVLSALLLLLLQKGQGLKRTPLDLPLWAWTAVAFFSLVWAVNPTYSLNEIVGEVLKGLLVYYLVYFSLSREEHLQQVYLVLVVGDFFMVAFDLIDFYWQGGSFREYTIRARSLHSGYGSFGTYLVTLYPFLLLGSFSPLLKRFRWALRVLLVMNLFSVYLTFGRAMWLAVGAETAFFGLFFRRKQTFLFLFLGLILFVIFIPKTVWFHGERLSPEGTKTVQSLGGTGGDLLEIWKLCLNFFKERPFQGIGFGRRSFSEAFPEFRATHQPLLWHAHNTFLDVFLQTGLQGLIIFLWLMGRAFILLIRWVKEGLSSWPAMTATACGIMILGFFVRNLFDDFYVDDSALLLWFLIATALSGISRKPSGLLSDPPRP